MLTELVNAIEALTAIRHQLNAAREMPSPLREEILWRLRREDEAAVARVTGLAMREPPESRLLSACLDAMAGGTPPGEQAVHIEDAALAAALDRLRAASESG